MPGLFITATGTDLGKTFVTAGLIRAMRARGKPVSTLKPVVSGFDEEHPQGSDPALLLAALGCPLTPADLDAIAPWRFKAPLSPDMAARKEGRTILFEDVLAFCKSGAAEHFTLVEGAGGIMVPLSPTATMLDLMHGLALPVLLIGGSYLGTISHILSALDVAQRRGLEIAAIIVNESENSPVSIADTLETLACFCGGVPLLPLARLAEGAARDVAFAALAEKLHLL